MELLKDKYFQEEFIIRLGNDILLRSKTFDIEVYKKILLSMEYSDLELKDKLRKCAETIGDCLKLDYLDAIEVLMEVAPNYSNFDSMVFPEYVDIYGQFHFDESLKALGYFTMYGSSEFAIRSFANTDTDKVLEYMKMLSKSDNEHKRRFASEGCRPKLPWAKSVKNLNKEKYLIEILKILEILKEDSSLYVRKSVANNLNDISKLNPELVLNTARNWINKNEYTDWILKHGLRTLLKKGNKEALSLWGLNDSTGVEVQEFYLENQVVNIGDTTNLVLIFKVMENKKIRGEFNVHYLKNKGNHSIKTFSFFEKSFESGTYTIKKKISFKEMSTRKHYEGLHKIYMMINGDDKMCLEFNLGSE
jgi:3-methyladenine DNA glycosylase AlkC